MSGWYLAPALVVLRAEINTRWPHRDRTSDGSIGDAAHQAAASDHNPNSRGAVDAIDVDKDGIDPYVVLDAVQRHPSAHYWIFQRQIADRDDGWRRRPYDGRNPHDKHLHVSIRQTRTAEQDRRPWGLLEDDMLTKADIDAIALRVWTWDLHNGDGTDEAYRVLNRAAAAAVAAAGADPVDEQAVAVELLKVLTPQAIAQALPDDVARQVADELARRMVS